MQTLLAAVGEMWLALIDYAAVDLVNLFKNPSYIHKSHSHCALYASEAVVVVTTNLLLVSVKFFANAIESSRALLWLPNN